jgi:hypothetical protein
VLNVSLLRREPPVAPPPVLRTIPALETAASLQPTPPPIVAAPMAEETRLRDELKALKIQIAVAKACLELDRKTVLGPPTPPEQPDARDFHHLEELLDSFLEQVSVNAVTETGEALTIQKPVLTPHNREQALGILEDYVALDPGLRLAFRRGMTAAVEQYRRIQDQRSEEWFAATHEIERLRKQERHEEAKAAEDRLSQRDGQRQEAWARDHVGPLCSVLDAQDGIRPALLSRKLSDLLIKLASPDEQ